MTDTIIALGILIGGLSIMIIVLLWSAWKGHKNDE